MRGVSSQIWSTFFNGRVVFTDSCFNKLLIHHRLSKPCIPLSSTSAVRILYTNCYCHPYSMCQNQVIQRLSTGPCNISNRLNAELALHVCFRESVIHRSAFTSALLYNCNKNVIFHRHSCRETGTEPVRVEAGT